MIRDAIADDIPQITKLFKGLGYNVTQNLLTDRFKSYYECETHRLLVDEEDGIISGIIGSQLVTPFHSQSKIGRITTLVFGESYGGNRSGKALLEASEAFFIESGCGTSEVTSSIMGTNAGAILKRMGYKETQHCTKRISG